MTNNIDQSIPIPLYYQLKNFIRQQIEQGELLPGEKIPTEAELCEQFSISRTPVRQALLELTNEGYLTRKAGRGTFVAPREQTSIDLEVIVPDTRWQWLLEAAASSWNAQIATQTINLNFVSIPLAELHDALTFAVARGQAPDISILDSVWVAEFAHRHYLYAVEELDAARITEIGPNFYNSVLAASSYENKLYAIPTNADASVLWYRRDWFEAEGLAPPHTWRDLVALGHHFRQSPIHDRYGLGPYPIAFAGGRAGGETTTYHLLPLLWSSGADVIFDDAVVIDSEDTRQVLTFLRSLIHSENLVSPDVIEYSWNDALCAFAQGQVALAFGGTYENFLIQTEANWDNETFHQHAAFVPFPAGPNGVSTTLVGGMTYGIYRQSHFPMEALALLKVALSSEILKPFSLRTGQNASLVSVAQAIRQEEDGFLASVAPLLTHGRSRPSLPEYDRVSQQLQEMVELCLEGQVSIDAIVRRTAERISAITGLPVS